MIKLWTLYCIPILSDLCILVLFPALLCLGSTYISLTITILTSRWRVVL